MAREEKRYELTPVDDTPEPDVTVIRLGNAEKAGEPKPTRLTNPSPPPEVSQRLALPNRADFDSRTHQPGIEALIEQNIANPDQLEQDWAKKASEHSGVQWGWFVLIGLIVAAGAAWSLNDLKNAGTKVEQIREDTVSLLDEEAEQDRQAGELIARIDRVTRQFSAAATVDQMAEVVRNPERVRPLMERYYRETPLSSVEEGENTILQPLTLDNRADFWMKQVRLANGENRNLMLEVEDSGEIKIDWETFVCYQPMRWDTFATTRPAGSSLDFRVLVEPDNFFSHEFADQDQWDSYRLTALDNDETLFGYARKDSDLSKEIRNLIDKNQGEKTALILRLGIPEGLQSRRGVVIEKLLSNRWLYIVPPESGS